MEIIKSKDNSLIKLFLSLKEKKGRELSNLFLVEGKKMVRDAVVFEKDVKFIVVSESKKNEFDYFLSLIEGESLKKTHKEQGLGVERIELKIISDSLAERISDTKTTQGVFAAVAMEKREFSLPKQNALILDRIRDPANLGTIIRTAVASCYNDIYLLDCADEYNPKVVRGTMSGIYHTRFYHVNLTDIKYLKKNNIQLICADMNGENLFNVSLPKMAKYAIIIGNEASGVGKDLKIEADYTYSIPMEKIESLNASITAGIFMYYLNLKS